MNIKNMKTRLKIIISKALRAKIKNLNLQEQAKFKTIKAR